MPSGRRCCVPGCTGKGRFAFPGGRSKEELRRCMAWIRAVNNPRHSTMTRDQICRLHLVCDNHFSPNCYIIGLDNVRRPRPDRIPDMNLYWESSDDSDVSPQADTDDKELQEATPQVEEFHEVAPEHGLPDCVHNTVTPKTELVDFNEFCAVCKIALEVKSCSSIRRLVNADPNVEAFKVLESISKFKFIEGEASYLCMPCFDKTKEVYEFQQMCNKAQTTWDDIIQESTSEELFPEGLQADNIADVVTNNDAVLKIIEPELATRWPKQMKSTPVPKGITDRPYFCAQCKQAYQKREVYERHRRIVHMNNIEVRNTSGYGNRKRMRKDMYFCPYCDETFALKESLVMHTVIHSSYTELPFMECDIEMNDNGDMGAT